MNESRAIKTHPIFLLHLFSFSSGFSNFLGQILFLYALQWSLMYFDLRKRENLSMYMVCMCIINYTVIYVFFFVSELLKRICSYIMYSMFVSIFGRIYMWVNLFVHFWFLVSWISYMAIYLWHIYKIRYITHLRDKRFIGLMWTAYRW